eukprot:UN02647
MKAKDKNKGRISRYLANKAAMAVRLDCFLDKPTDLYGKAFRDQVEERLAFFKEGKVPSKNIDVMNKVRMQLDIEEMEEDVDLEITPPNVEKVKKKKKKKRKLEETEGIDDVRIVPAKKKQKVEDVTEVAQEQDKSEV